MELRHLRYFVAIANSRSFTVAAERLGVSQPTLSHQIKQLETELGMSLLLRGARHVELTEAGREFMPHCDRLFKELDGGLQGLSDLKGLLRGTLRIAVFHSFSSSLLGGVMARFALRHTGVRVIARLLPRAAMERDLASGDLDLAVAYVADHNEALCAERLFEEELVLVVGASHPLARRRKVEMAAIGDLDLVLLTPEFASRQVVDDFLRERAIEARIVLEMNAIDPILSIVRQGTLATVLSEGAIGNETGLKLVRLVNPTPRRWAAILWRRGGEPSAAAQRLAAMIREAYGLTSETPSVAVGTRIAPRPPHIHGRPHP